jgi:hypothetical protein
VFGVPFGVLRLQCLVPLVWCRFPPSPPIHPRKFPSNPELKLRDDFSPPNATTPMGIASIPARASRAIGRGDISGDIPSRQSAFESVHGRGCQQRNASSIIPPPEQEGTMSKTDARHAAGTVLAFLDDCTAVVESRTEGSPSHPMSTLARRAVRIPFMIYWDMAEAYPAPLRAHDRGSFRSAIGDGDAPSGGGSAGGKRSRRPAAHCRRCAGRPCARLEHEQVIRGISQ